jgi:hypothetical protein
MSTQITRLSLRMVVAGLALTLLTTATLPLLGHDAAVAKGGHSRSQRHDRHEGARGTPQQGLEANAITAPVFIDVGITDLALDPQPIDATHRAVVVTVANNSLVPVSGFTIGLAAVDRAGVIRPEEFSAPLSLSGGRSTTVSFRMGCRWLDGGRVTVRTNPSPVPGEASSMLVNNTRIRFVDHGCA